MSQATAIVTCEVRVMLSQPWAGNATVDEVNKAAAHEAKQKMGQLIHDRPELSLNGPVKVRVIFEERD
jgi:hypothetical protein